MQALNNSGCLLGTADFNNSHIPFVGIVKGLIQAENPEMLKRGRVGSLEENSEFRGRLSI